MGDWDWRAVEFIPILPDNVDMNSYMKPEDEDTELNVRRKAVYFGLHERSVRKPILRRLQREIKTCQKDLDRLFQETDDDGKQDKMDRRYLVLRKLYRNLNIFESEALIQQAEKLAVDIPSKLEKPSWWEEDEKGDEELLKVVQTEWLSPVGRTGASKLIKKERRNNLEWWVKIIAPILASIIGLLGLIVALVSISRK